MKKTIQITRDALEKALGQKIYWRHESTDSVSFLSFAGQKLELEIDLPDSTHNETPHISSVHKAKECDVSPISKEEWCDLTGIGWFSRAASGLKPDSKHQEPEKCEHEWELPKRKRDLVEGRVWFQDCLKCGNRQGGIEKPITKPQEPKLVSPAIVPRSDGFMCPSIPYFATRQEAASVFPGEFKWPARIVIKNFTYEKQEDGTQTARGDCFFEVPEVK